MFDEEKDFHEGRFAAVVGKYNITLCVFMERNLFDGEPKLTAVRRTISKPGLEK